MSSNYKSPTVFSSDKPYSHYVTELEAWAFVDNLPKEKHSSHIKVKVFSELDI